MIRTLIYSVLILAFLGVVLIVGLIGPEHGNRAAQRLMDFLNWKPHKKSEGLLLDTEVAVKQFNQSYQNIQIIRQMTLQRSKKSFEELDDIYRETRDQLKKLLMGMEELSPEERKEMFDKFTVMHSERASLVGDIIRDQQIMININEQMDQQLRAMSQWLNQKTNQAAGPSGEDVLRMQQYEGLKKSLKAFNEQSSQLDSMRILFMSKNKDSIERLAMTNNELENRFRGLLVQVGQAGQAILVAPEQNQQLWDDYQKLEAEQRELVANLNTTEEFITENHAKMISSVGVISRSVEYRSDTQLKRFRDSFLAMEARRREMLASSKDRQQVYLSTQPSVKRMMEDNKYRMETMREQARHISDQYAQMEEYRRSAVSMIRDMSDELRDQSEFSSQQTRDVMERSRTKIEAFLQQMDANEKDMQSFIKISQKSPFANNASMKQIVNLQNRSSMAKANIQQAEQQLRSINEQNQRDAEAAIQAKKDLIESSEEKMINLKERSEDQRRAFAERLQDQMITLRERQTQQQQMIRSQSQTKPQSQTQSQSQSQSQSYSQSGNR